MSEACKYLHDKIASFPRFSIDYAAKLPSTNGLYFVFENGESGHGRDRIVRIGTHDGENNLGARLKEHLVNANKDRSVFRKHIGRSILNRRSDPYLQVWNIDMTERAKKMKFGHLQNAEKQLAIEVEVTNHIVRNLRFTAIAVEGGKEKRKQLERNLISTVAQCSVCQPSKEWLGSFHPDLRIRESGLWNIQGLRGKGASLAQLGDL